MHSSIWAQAIALKQLHWSNCIETIALQIIVQTNEHSNGRVNLFIPVKLVQIVPQADIDQIENWRFWRQKCYQKYVPPWFLRCKTIARWLLILIEPKHTESTIVFVHFSNCIFSIFLLAPENGDPSIHPNPFTHRLWVIVAQCYIRLWLDISPLLGLTSSIFWLLLRMLIIVIVYLVTATMHEGNMMNEIRKEKEN